jgi:hypothetical protein
VKDANLRHLRTLAEIFGVDCAGVQSIEEMADEHAIPKNLCEVEDLCTGPSDAVIGRQKLTFHQPFRTQLPLFLRHLANYFPVAPECVCVASVTSQFTNTHSIIRPHKRTFVHDNFKFQ